MGLYVVEPKGDERGWGEYRSQPLAPYIPTRRISASGKHAVPLFMVVRRS